MLMIAKKIIKCPAAHKDILIGAFVGACLTCLIIILPIPYSFVKILMFHGLVSIVMVKTGLRVKWGRTFFKAYVVLYFSSFVVGGLFTSFRQYMREGSMFFGFALITYYGVSKLWDFVASTVKCKDRECEVMLFCEESQLKVKAMIDTGNRLRDPYTAKPVSILSKEAASMLQKEADIKQLRYISYHTIGKKCGTMPMFPIKSMCLYLDEEIWIDHPLIAISEEHLSTEGYEMILNPDVK